MDLVDEEHLALGEVGQDRRQVARTLEHGSGRRPHRHAQLIPDHIRQRRLAEPWRPVQEHVIESLAAALCRRNRHLQVGPDPILSDVAVQGARAQAGFVLNVVVSA